MNKMISELILYNGIKEDPAVCGLCEVCDFLHRFSFREVTAQKSELMGKVNAGVKAVTDTAEHYGFAGDAWKQYLTLLLIKDENPFSLQAEGCTVKKTGTISDFALQDIRVIRALFDFDFSALETSLNIKHFSRLKKYRPSKNRAAKDPYETGQMIGSLAEKIAAAEDEKEAFSVLAAYYKEHGAGIFGMHTAFRITEPKGSFDPIELLPVAVDRSIALEDLVGLEHQKRQLRSNTRAFCKGKRSNDVLLYGDNGTGKSTSIKGILNEYAGQGLRLVEVNKYQFRLLPELISRIEDRNYHFIIFIDDLSFEEDEIEYKFLKSVIEGGIENRPDNVLIYATSNRRHLIKEVWDDRKDMEYDGDIHHSDTIEEKISLSSRFGVTINFSKPNKKEFEEIVLELAKRENLKIEEKVLLAEANKWELRHGGFTGRVARQFVNYMAGLEGGKEQKC